MEWCAYVMNWLGNVPIDSHHSLHYSKQQQKIYIYKIERESNNTGKFEIAFCGSFLSRQCDDYRDS